ncbi:glycoside hydrolase family 16 protein [Mucilaginibacter agri]|uniref:Family 16 glycosylhydrolase n=1 Tax=Mucilaginibacter agri TaxID=2695265 RepID=A0A966DUF4_9SPHI|nr:glycoside hydrolase family 16 protein [Mucilaginibacter agri]NCD69594.1 family 16 glycosylhydrolase [Mucilaginibacter agri]
MTSSRVTLALLGLAMLSCGSKGSAPVPDTTTKTTPADKVYTFESTPYWADEFNSGAKPDTSKWGYDIGGDGWGNHELEYYTNASNADISNGNLNINLRKEKFGNNNYTSARLFSKGTTGNFTYGRFEVRAKLPAGKGTWPAIWMLPTDYVYGGWPKSGEIDIMEHVGYDPTNIHITVHTDAYNHTIGTQKSAEMKVPTALTDFHVYRVDWTPTAITGYIDDTLVFTFKNEGTGSAAWPFDKRFHLMLNLAYGGDWGGAQGVDDSVLPATMQVDYVRVYRVNNL